jgi:hypothetical protein
VADLQITSLRGGMNNTDPAIALPEDQCVLAQNVEYVESMLGERRLGTTAITLPAFLSGKDRVPFLFRHLPTADETAAELWALGVTSTTTVALGRKTASWSEITISDTPTLTGFSQYRWQAVTLHGKIHFFYDSNVDRPHVWDGTTMRRSGFEDTYSAPTSADAGSGTLTGTRYGRVRFVEVSGSTVLRRSEPSAVKTHSPSGTGASITWTRPTAPSEGETHWEVELSTDNANFYRMDRIALATTTHSDSVVYATGYAATGTLSEDTGDYTPLWSARYATADEDRLVIAGSWEDDALASRVGWTPVFNADGVGNDERLESDTDPTKDLDTYKYGPVTGLSEPILGGIWVTKQHAVYKLSRTGKRDVAYEADLFSAALGGIHGSLVSGVDETGQPCLYAIDFEQGPYRIGIGGIKRCGEDLRATWSTLNINATAVVTQALYYPKKKQVIWCLATDANNRPDKAVVLHVDKARPYADGIRKGWALWTGTRASALSMCLFASNIDDNTTRNLNLVPFIGLEGSSLVHRCDTGTDDNGTAFVSTITSKPYFMRSPAHHFEARAAALMGKATTNAKVDVKCIRDFGIETTVTVSDVTFTASGSETQVTNLLDSFKGAEMEVGQFQFTDVASPSAQWQLNRFDVVSTDGQAP